MKRTETLRVRLTAREHLDLLSLCQHSGQSRSAVVRALLRRTIDQVPPWMHRDLRAFEAATLQVRQVALLLNELKACFEDQEDPAYDPAIHGAAMAKLGDLDARLCDLIEDNQSSQREVNTA